MILRRTRRRPHARVKTLPPSMAKLRKLKTSEEREGVMMVMMIVG